MPFMTHQTEQFQDDVAAGPGGAMTDEVGVVTGDLTVHTSQRPDGRADVRVQYTGADERYTLTGSPCPVPLADLKALHQTVLAAIRSGGGAHVPG
ncbi:hypothetical protein [Streptomyces sp. NPDC051162]|uniref:hypothetical protein n=1 Tax=Streptomyces sp. NPDC051162 TaxID=3154747 RepID=UPI0034264862